MNQNHSTNIINDDNNDLSKNAELSGKQISGINSSKKFNNKCFRESPLMIGSRILRPICPVFTPKEYQHLSDKFNKKLGSHEMNSFISFSIENNVCND